jgi:integrase
LSVKKRGKSRVWWCDFQIKRKRVRQPIPEARTKYEAEQAEVKLKRDMFERKYGKEFGTMLFYEFVGDPEADQFKEGTFLAWAKINKRSWKHDQFRVRPLVAAFKGKTLGDITTDVVERFKAQRRNSLTKYDTTRSPASVNRELDLLSRIFSLAIFLGHADSNPCSRVSKFKLQNQRHRYLLPDEEPALLDQCTGGKRKHLANMIRFALGTGARKSEQLSLKVRQVDFFRGLIVFDKTKSGRPRTVEMNSEVRQILLDLCRGKRPDDHVWISPKTGEPYTDVKTAFASVCKDAKIEGLVWHDLRATYGTRLGEAGYNAYDIAKLMGHASITTSQRYVRNLPIGAGEAVMLKNVRHKCGTSDVSATFPVAVNS